ncbi:MAG: hypothetical protein M0D57_11465 [Sphingobacteriales bacterium JAD_PAG50586_3]|nr:MAG: hypothetical protein M0D57_11465 [Sphingobacteriales bacterium JAD_PAG50586_3]
MITATDRKKIAKLVLTTNDDTIIEKIKTLVSANLIKEKQSFVKTYNNEIDKAVKEAKQGKFYTQEQAELFLAAWEKE